MKRLNKNTAVFTPDSKTTELINYSATFKILEVAFKDNKEVYHYFNVPLKLWNEYKAIVKKGESSGRFVNKKIKPFYKFIKLNEGSKR